jgi:hypothetical protein
MVIPTVQIPVREDYEDSDGLGELKKLRNVNGLSRQMSVLRSLPRQSLSCFKESRSPRKNSNRAMGLRAACQRRIS